MSLKTYRRKRDFRRTREPRGRRPPAPAAKGLAFVIQKHAARRLHYDFRLEMEGVLRSWAVPKGPCLDPRERRLAVNVEDHPLEYGSFEGEIPQGEYGGGTVLLWDNGTWLPEGDPVEGFRKGRLKFRLEGKKLRGEWLLVQMRGPSSEGGKNWLLIKERDDEARPLEEGDITAERPESVAGAKAAAAAPAGRSRRRERPLGAARRPRTRRPAAVAPPEAAPLAPLPDRIEPQLATLADRVPEGDEWLHEIKFDGYRILARVEGSDVRLLSRRDNEWTKRFPEITSALRVLGARQAVLDGEVVILDPNGRSDFQRLQNALRDHSSSQAVYYAFDLLHLDGRDLRGLPLAERKELLAALLSKTAPDAGTPGGRVRYADHLEGEGSEIFAQACRLGLEGVVSKRRDAPYRGGRGPQWLKIKCVHEQEFVIAGWTEPGGSRERFGALLLGYYDRGELVFAGRVGTGFDQRTLRDVHARLAPLETSAPPFQRPPTGADARGVHWVRPALVAQIVFSEWTDEGILRQPVFHGLREDKKPEEVVREEPRRPSSPEPAAPAKPAPPPAPRSAPKGSVLVAGVPITHPERVVYPDQGLTKLALAEYYESVAARILPHVAERPLAIIRCPEGREGECFFQKHVTARFPKAVKAVEIVEKGTPSPYITIDGLEGLIGLVQFGALELHPWGSKAADLERPDRITFDLDPDPGIPWQRIIDAAFELRERLKVLKFAAFLKTTGGKGLHVVVPLEPRARWDKVKEFSRSLVDWMARDAPEKYTASLSKSARGGKIFVDYLRNGRGATAVAAYSTRARPGAPVSTPIDWKELTPELGSSAFHVANFAARLKRKDPWADLDDAARPLPE